MPPTAALQASISGGANQTGGISAVDGDTCQLSGVSTVGWAMQRFEIYSFPEGFALPAGFTIDAVTGAYYYAASPTCPIFTMTPWGKYLFRLTIGVSSLGLGLDRDGNADPALVDNTCAVSILSPAGLADLAWNETTQFSQDKKWVYDQAANLRILNSGLGGGTVPNTRTITAGVGLTGGGNLMADRTIAVGANADGSIQVNADDIQVGQLATDGQHGARGGGTQHAAVTTSVNGFMTAADKVRLDGMGDGATVATITGTAPINITGGDANPDVSIDPASGASAGSMSAAHYTLVNNATAAATANTLGKRDSNADIAHRRLELQDELHFIAGGALKIVQLASTTGNGTAGTLFAQDAKSGAYTGGSLEIGGGNGGDASHNTGSTTVQVGALVSGAQSAHFIVDAKGTKVLDVALDGPTNESRISAGGLPVGFGEASRFRGAVALTPQAMTYASTIGIDAAQGSRRDLILTASTTFTTPTNFDDGSTLELFIEYGPVGMGPYTVTWPGSTMIFPTGITSALLGSNQFDTDYYEFKKRGAYWVCVIHNMHIKP